jgi:hypothetical protein
VNFLRQFQTLQNKQLALQEGVALLEQARRELQQSRAVANAWGLTAVLANATLIPLNCIVNAFELKSANTAYQLLVRTLYDKFARSGTRLEGPAKNALSMLKKAIVDELKRKALTDLVPGVNILVGLVEDSAALMQVTMVVDAGGRENASLAADIDRRLADFSRRLAQLGIEHAELITRVQRVSRIA